ncbi:MAG TPA: alpha/beta fold hydrolase [Candidatus Methylacidiphilales bacterium]|nr:alpha/beta fold hydrolase [Candidatus Methylacidiphilales bacterium]
MIGAVWRSFSKLPWWHPVKLVSRVLIWIVVAFAALCGIMYAMQGKLIYPAAGQAFTREQVEKIAADAGLMPWTPVGDADPVGFFPSRYHFEKPRGTIVVLHGNGEYAWYHAETAQELGRRGFLALLYEYPGYGGRPGSPSERSIVPDLQGVVRALDTAGYGPVYIWGQSLGAGVAAAACADESLPVKGLLLITPWDSLPNVGAAFYPYIPVHWLMIDRYDSIANLAHFQHPIFLARSDHDEVIPPKLSMNLYAHLPEPKKELVFVNAGHNSWPGETPDSWLDEALDFIAPR